MAQDTGKVRQYAHLIHGIFASFCMRVVVSQQMVAVTVQPMPFAIHIDTGLIGMKDG